MLNNYRLVLSLVRLFIEIYKGKKAEIVRQSRFCKGVTLGRKQIIFVISKYCLSIDLCEAVKLFIHKSSRLENDIWLNFGLDGIHGSTGLGRQVDEK